MGIVGTRLDNTYTIIEEIGHGGGGIVYKAYHERLKTFVVVKKVRDKVKGILESRAEADILKDMKHTYLPRVYDFLEIDGEIYTVMDYIPGENLKTLLEREHVFSQKMVLGWAIQLAEALDYLHSRIPPVIHSDIKPANIMLTPEGNICLIDFNISLAFDREMKTSTGTSAGYSPPEQYRSKNRYYSSIDDTDEKNEGFPGSKSPDTNKNRTHGKVSGSQEDVTLTAAGDKGCGTEDTELMEIGWDAGETVTMETAPASGTPGSSVISKSSEICAIDTVSGTKDATQSIVEQLIGGGVDERSDIYSLGATLYHLVTGRRPPTNFEQILPVTECGVDISEGFAHIIRKMTELQPDMRYQDGAELLDALRHIYTLDSEYIAFHRRWRRRRRLAGLLYGAAFFLMAMGAAVSVREGNLSYTNYVETANSLIKEENYDGAEELLDRGIALRPQRIEAYRVRLLSLYARGEYDNCILYGRQILNAPEYQVRTEEDRQNQADIYYILGNSYFEQEDYENAATCFGRALETSGEEAGERPQYYRDQAAALARMGKIEDSKAALEKARKMGLSRDSLNMAEGEILYASGDYGTAARRLSDAAISARDGDMKKRAALLYAKACALQDGVSIEEEISVLKKVRASMGASASLAITECIANAYARKAGSEDSTREQDYQMALQEFLSLYNAGYHTLQTMENIVIVYEQLGKFAEAEELLARMEEQYPESYECYKRRAFLEADRQQTLPVEERNYEQAVQAYEKAEKFYGERIETDEEMQMLRQLMLDLKKNGWINEIEGE